MEKEFLMPKGNNHICIHDDLKTYWLLCYWLDDESGASSGKMFKLFRDEMSAFKYLVDLGKGAFNVSGWIDPVNVHNEYI